MYEDYFDIKEPAFSIAVNPRYLFMSQQHREALAHLLYGVSGGGFVMLTGEVGTGKTTIIRCLLEQLPDDTDLAIILNPMSDRVELLTSICDELGVGIPPKDPGIKQLMDSLSHFLLKNHERGRRTLLLIDEAQLLSVEALEQIRLLTNLETTTQKLLHIMLVGQPELKQLIGKPELRQLSQRITARFHLNPLSLKETQAYINHRLKVAGLPEGRSPFPFAIVKQIHKISGGVPRLINVICERCLLGSYAQQTRQVTREILRAAAVEILGSASPSTHKQTSHTKLIAGASVVTLLFAGLVFWNWQTKSLTPTNTSLVKHFSSAMSSTTSSATSSAPQVTIADHSYANYTDAENQFLLWLGFPLAMENRPCSANSDAKFLCEKIKLSSWRDIQELGHPVILVLNTPEKFSRYVVLVGINSTHGLVLDENQTTTTIPLTNLGQRWTGEIFYLWTNPPGFENTLTLGDSGPTVEWVSQQFAKLDKQKNPLADDLLTLNLQERLKIFQRSQNLNMSGNIDKATLQQLNLKLAIDKSLLKEFKTP